MKKTVYDCASKMLEARDMMPEEEAALTTFYNQSKPTVPDIAAQMDTATGFTAQQRKYLLDNSTDPKLLAALQAVDEAIAAESAKVVP